MKLLRSAVTAAALSLLAYPAAAGALQAAGIALVGRFAECSAGVSNAPGGATNSTGLSAEAMQVDSATAPAAQAMLRDYLEFHAQAQEDTGARAALMPWPALRTHAN